MLLEASIQTVAENTAVVTLTGPLTLGTSLKTFDTQIHQAIEKNGLTRLVVDMAGVPYMDSAGLGALIHAFGLSKENGGALRLTNVTDKVASLLKMTHTDSLLAADASVESSLASLG